MLIDDMSDTTGAQIRLPAPSGDVPGYWFTYNCANTGCAATTCSGVSQVPAQFSHFFYTPIGSATGTDAGSALSVASGPSDAGSSISHAACTSGMLGAGHYPFAAEAFNFATVPPSAADAGDGAPPVPVTIDVSSHMGIQFWAYGDPGAGMQPVTVMLPDHATSQYGGVCNADASACPADLLACGAYGTQNPVMIGPGWQYVQVLFSSLAQNVYYGLPEATFDMQHVYGVEFQEQTNAPDAGNAPFGFCIADITFF